MCISGWGGGNRIDKKFSAEPFRNMRTGIYCFSIFTFGIVEISAMTDGMQLG